MLAEEQAISCKNAEDWGQTVVNGDLYSLCTDIQGKYITLRHDNVQFSCTPGSNCQTQLYTDVFSESLVILRGKTFQLWKISQVDDKGLGYIAFCKWEQTSKTVL